MRIQLWGGAADGLELIVPDGTTVWVVRTPTMTTAEFLALEHTDPAVPLPEPRELGYQVTRKLSPSSGARRATYVGERAKT